MKCPKCGYDNRPHVHICSACGFRFTGFQPPGRNYAVYAWVAGIFFAVVLFFCVMLALQ